MSLVIVDFIRQSLSHVFRLPLFLRQATNRLELQLDSAEDPPVERARVVQVEWANIKVLIVR